MGRTNWAGNHTYQSPQLIVPESLEELREQVRRASHLRALGSRHSFNDIADTIGPQISLARLNRILSIDAENRQVWIEGGARYGDIAPALHQSGFALANLASLPHISVAGAVMTATHGSGSALGNLATQVSALRIVKADGETAEYSRDRSPSDFEGAVVSLGALGIVAALCLDIEPTYQVRQQVHVGLEHRVLQAEFDAIMDSASSVSVFTGWQGDRAHSVWFKERVYGSSPVLPATDVFGAPAATRPLHPLPEGNGEDCTVQMSVPGPWHERLPHFRMEFSPSNGAEIQAEYFLPRDTAAAGIGAMLGLGDLLAPVLLVSELRTVAPDSLWLSPGQRGPYLAIHFTFRRDAAAVAAVLPSIEATLLPFGAIPHWGKVSTIAPWVIRAAYPRLGQFRQLAGDLDPTGKFRNQFMSRLLEAA